MAVNRISVSASPQKVWKLLADPFAYPKWVVGSQRTLSADREWPQPGSAFRVRVGREPLAWNDRTEVKECVKGKRLVLAAGGGGIAGAHVEIELTERPDGGCDISLTERPGGLSAPLAMLPPLQLAIKARNARSLARLRRLVEA